MRCALCLGVVLIAGCPGKNTAPPADPAPKTATCDDVRATAVRLNVVSEVERPPPSFLFAQEAAPEEEDPGAIWYDECVRFEWSQAKIVCFTGASDDDAARACAQGEAPVAAADPSCVAAADQSAIRLANDAGVAEPARSELMADGRAAILEACNEARFTDDMLECLIDPEVVDDFGVCGVLGGEDWDRIVRSLEARGFSR